MPKTKEPIDEAKDKAKKKKPQASDPAQDLDKAKLPLEKSIQKTREQPHTDEPREGAEFPFPQASRHQTISRRPSRLESHLLRRERINGSQPRELSNYREAWALARKGQRGEKETSPAGADQGADIAASMTRLGKSGLAGIAKTSLKTGLWAGKQTAKAGAKLVFGGTISVGGLPLWIGVAAAVFILFLGVAIALNLKSSAPAYEPSNDIWAWTEDSWNKARTIETPEPLFVEQE